MVTKLSDIRILMFTRTMAMGGTEKIILELCRALKGRVGFLGVVSCGGELVSELDALGVPHYEVPDITEKNLAVFVRVAHTLKRIVSANNINLVHCHHRMAALYCRLLLPKSTRAVATAHNVFTDSKAVTRFLYHGMYIAACGGRVRDNLIDYYGLPKDRITLIPNSVPRFDGKVKKIPEIELLSSKVIKVGFVGRLTEAKGVGYLIDAMGILEKKGIKANCLIVGNGDLENDLRMRVGSMGMFDEIRFLGSRDDSQNFLSQVDICAIPSLWEGLPLVLLEAFSVGAPVVASACDGLLDVVVDGLNGLLVQPGNAEALADGIERLCLDDELRLSIGNRAKSDYESNYSFETWLKSYISFYEGAL